MFWRRSLNTLRLACPTCKEVFQAREVLFVCPEPRCSSRTLDLPDRPIDWTDRPVFTVREFDHAVECPHSLHRAHRKLCPRCWCELPLSTGNLSTVAVIGSSASGKTCYMTALVYQINKRLARADSYQMSLEWDDDAGRIYFESQYDTIFNLLLPPDQTQREGNLQTVQITVRFPIRNWLGKRSNDRQAVVSLVLPDPSGEFFDRQEDVYYLNYLSHARAIILMVDPMMSERYRRKLPPEERELLDYKASPPDVALGNFVKALRRETNQHTGRLNKQLAVVLTKCDEKGMFDPDDPKHAGQFPRQGRYYDIGLADMISNQVALHLRNELEMDNLVSLAENSFKEVRFFAVSALGKPPLRSGTRGNLTVRLDDPSPRRVEEPLLWILHRWGYL